MQSHFLFTEHVHSSTWLHAHHYQKQNFVHRGRFPCCRYNPRSKVRVATTTAHEPSSRRRFRFPSHSSFTFSSSSLTFVVLGQISNSSAETATIHSYYNWQPLTGSWICGNTAFILWVCPVRCFRDSLGQLAFLKLSNYSSQHAVHSVGCILMWLMRNRLLDSVADNSSFWLRHQLGCCC